MDQFFRKEDFEKYLREHIPVTAAMGVEVEEASQDQVILLGKFANNINHKKTVFGGSLHAVATLACWSLLHMNLVRSKREAPGEIVIVGSSVNFLHPVTSDFRASTRIPEQEKWERFLKVLDRKGKGKVELSAQIMQDGKVAVDYVGTFAALR